MKKIIITLVFAFALATTASAAPLKASTLRIGSTGETVKSIQQKLIDLQYLSGIADGKYGRKTANAVRSFQFSQSMKVDGLAGEKTIAKILASGLPSAVGTVVVPTDNAISSDIKNNPSSSPTTSTTSIKTNERSKTETGGLRTTKPIVPVIPIDEPVIPISTEVQWMLLCRDGKPHIQVLSPNGGEIYQAGQQVEVKWRSCNVSNTAFIRSSVTDMVNGRDFIVEFANQLNNNSFDTQNDGQELMRVNPNGIVSGKRYKITLQIFMNDGVPMVGDTSDNLFTINALQPKVQVGTSTTNPPASTVLASQTQTTNNVRLLGFTVKAIDGDVILSKVPVQISATGHQPNNIIGALKLVDANGNILQTADSAGYHIDSGTISNVSGCAALNCGYTFANFGNMRIQSGETKEFSIIADLRAMNAGGGYAVGDTLKVSIVNNDVVLPNNLVVTNQNGDTITANSTYRIGSALGNVRTINSGATSYAPEAVTLNPIFVNQNSINFDGYYKMNGCAGTTYFEYGPTSGLGAITPAVARTDSGSMQQTVQGLTPQTTYYYRAAVQNCMGISRGDIRAVVTTGIIKQPVETTASY